MVRILLILSFTLLATSTDAADAINSRNTCATGIGAETDPYAATDVERTRALLVNTGFGTADVVDSPLAVLRDVFLLLSPDERLAVILGGGLDGKPGRTRPEITAILRKTGLMRGRTGERSRQIEASGIRTLKWVASLWPIAFDDEPGIPRSVYELSLTPAAARALVRCGLFTLWRLTQQTADDLLECDRVDSRTIVQTEKALAKLGLSMAGAPFAKKANQSARPVRQRPATPELAAIAQLTEAEKFNLPISVMGFGPRAQRALARSAVRTLGELMALSEAALREQRNFGLKTLEEVRSRMREAGLSFRP